MATELRLRCALELAIHHEFYSYELGAFTSVKEADIKKIIARCAQKSNSASVGEILALSNVVSRKVTSIFPDLPSSSDEVKRVMNFSASPRIISELEELTILWTSARKRSPRETCLPDHFVPVVGLFP